MVKFLLCWLALILKVKHKEKKLSYVKTQNLFGGADYNL